MSEPVTSNISVTRVGTSVRNKKSIYTATKVTKIQSNPPQYKTEIIRYSDAKGNDPVTIGTRNTSTGKINFNDNASTTEQKYSASLGKTSTGQISSVADSVTSNASEKAALNAIAGKGNQALGSGVEKKRPVGGQGGNKSRYSSGVAGAADDTQSKDAAADIIKPSKAKAGTRTDFGGSSPIIFPEALSSIDRDVIKFNMLEYRPSGMGKPHAKDSSIATMGTGRAGKGKILGSVVLPVPAGIADNNSVSWGSGSMTPMEAAMANTAMDALSRGLEGAGETMAKGFDDAKKNSDDVKKGIAATIAGTASGIGKQALQRGQGMVSNPNMELLFDGPGLRSFSFNFKLSPRSAREAQIVVKILRFFKQGMAPIMSESNFFLKAPHTFQLEYKQGGNKGRQHRYLNKFKECALQSCGVQYTPDGTYNTFTDGVMASYSLQLTFGELEPVFNNDYEGLAGIGY